MASVVQEVANEPEQDEEGPSETSQRLLFGKEFVFCLTHLLTSAEPFLKMFLDCFSAIKVQFIRAGR